MFDDRSGDMQSTDVAIVGAGPSGLAVAATCAEFGLNVVLLDEQSAPGGQIYRGITRAPESVRQVLGPDYASGEALVGRVKHPLIDYRHGATVWEVTRDRALHLTQGGRSGYLKASQVVLATGAMERPFPIPGWTLPGVMMAGAAQILLKTAGAVAAGPVVLAGSGPLLYLLANQYISAGVPISAVVDTTGAQDYRRALGQCAGALSSLPAIVKGLKMLRNVRKAGVNVYRAATGFKALGDDRVRQFEFHSGGTTHRIDVNVLLLHHGVVPNTQMTRSLRVPHDWSEQQLCWHARASAAGELDGLDEIFIVGDGARILGAESAAIQGRALGLEIACRHGKLPQADRDHQLAGLERPLARARSLRRFLDALYRPAEAHRVPDDPVVVCRCEEVTAGDLRAHVALGCLGPNQAKSFSRCGMGPCQGRQCGLSVTEIIAAARGVPPSEVGYFRIRSPVKPVTLGELAED